MKNNLNYQLHELVLLFSLMFFTVVYMIWGVVALDQEKVTVDEPVPEVVVTEPEIDISVPVEPEVVEPEVIEPEPEVEEPIVEYPQLWTDKDAIAITRMLYGEARGVGTLKLRNGREVSGKSQIAAVVWTVLNRYDAGFEDSIYEVVTAYDQYHGYSKRNPLDENLYALTIDVLDRWNREKHGETDVGRVIPSDYYWFTGDGLHNWFVNEYRSRNYWNWLYEDVYWED